MELGAIAVLSAIITTWIDDKPEAVAYVLLISMGVVQSTGRLHASLDNNPGTCRYRQGKAGEYLWLEIQPHVMPYSHHC